MFKLTLLFIFISGHGQMENPATFETLAECEEAGSALVKMNPYLEYYQIMDVKYLCEEDNDQ